MSNKKPLTFQTVLEVYKRLEQKERVDALHNTRLLDTPPERTFDNLTNLACKLLGAPVSLISLVDVDRQFFKSSQGLAEPWATQRETPLSHSFCQYVVANDQALVVEDAREEPMLCDNLAIRDLDVVAYLGVPLSTAEGYTLGSFCVIDNKPRVWKDSEIEILSDLAELAMKEIELHGYLRQLETAEEALRQREVELRELNMILEDQVALRTEALKAANEKLTDEIENRRHLEQEVMKVAEAERHRIGQDLHDDLQQQLGSIAILTDMIHNQMELEKSPHAESVEQIRQLIENSIDSTRRLAHSLAPVHVKQDGLAVALAQLVESMEMVSNISCRFEGERTVQIRDDEVATHLYRIAQEASTNAFKYARAQSIVISLVVQNKEGVLNIEDDGVGISEDALSDMRGLGLHTMHYRANLIHGELDVKRKEEGGTIVTCTFPVQSDGIPNIAVEQNLDQEDLFS